MRILAGLLAGLALILAAGAVATAILTARIERAFPPGGRFVEVAGGRLHYLEQGPETGRPLGTVVLLHGASANAADPMLALGRRLAGRYRVLAFDRPGQGWSDRIGGEAAAAPARQAALIAEGMRKLGVSGAVAVGHSFAGAVAPHLAIDHADVTGGIVILSGVTHPWPGEAISWYYHPATSLLGAIFTRTLTTPAGWLLVDATVRAVFAPEGPPAGYAEDARVALVLRPGAFGANADDVAGLHAAVTAQAPRYGAIRVPATVIGGDADRIVWTDLHARSFALAVPGARLVVLPGAGHMPHHTHAEAVAAEIDALAERVRGRAEAALPPAAQPVGP